MHKHVGVNVHVRVYTCTCITVHVQCIYNVTASNMHVTCNECTCTIELRPPLTHKAPQELLAQLSFYKIHAVLSRMLE